MGDMHPKFAEGLPRISPTLLNAAVAAERFDGLPTTLSRGHILAAFKRTAVVLSIAPRLRDAIDMLMAFSQDQDWQAGQRPIVWPSNALLQDQLGLCRRQVQYLLRMLIDAKLIVRRRQPHRPALGPPPSGHGQDRRGLRLRSCAVAVRYPEFVAAAERARGSCSPRRLAPASDHCCQGDPVDRRGRARIRAERPVLPGI
jgi:replication initiation protein RepC